MLPLSLLMVGRFVIYGDLLHLFGRTEPIFYYDGLHIVYISQASTRNISFTIYNVLCI